ncbi:response regulator [Archangium lipolyticum]|uniref:response regulator n=1 Tax=Archangium lipolyticum TaxID=2970465 RepID=UPI00214A0858|nr:response regulator [Archangium lipolyticum]
MARLLIVEDHPELASLMVAAAESRGHEATAVHTGEAALALLRPAAFHAAVVDLLLPDMRGSAVLSALRDHAIPAVAVSGVFKGDRFAREAIDVHGARAFFEKPFELLQLLESVEQLCGLTRPLSPPPEDEDEVVVFEDASLLDDEPLFDSNEDEPGFTSSDSSEDEPVFAPPPEAPAPMVQGGFIEEVQEPVRRAAPPPPLVVQVPIETAPIEFESTPEELVPPAQEQEQEPTAAEAPTPVTLKTEDLDEIGAMDELEPAEEEPAPAPAPENDPEELAALDALAPVEEAPAPENDPEELAALDSIRPVDSTPVSEISAEELRALDALAAAEEASAPTVTAEVAQALDALSPVEETPSPEATVSEATRDDSEPEPGIALPFGEREKVWTKPSSTPGTRRRPLPEWSLSGDLKDTSVPRLLNAYYEARHSGELKLRQGSLLKVIYFGAGRPIYAASNLAHERFLRFCVRRGVLPEAKAAEVATLAREQNLRSNEAMIRLGLLDAKKRQQLIEEQVKEILWSTFSWTEGAYGFSPLHPPRAGLVKLSVFPGDLILEGILRSEPLVTLRQQMHRSRRLFPSAAPAYGLHELKLKGQQALLLAYADGTKTVEDLLTITELPERDVLATLRGLELIGVLEERREEPSNSRRITFGL